MKLKSMTVKNASSIFLTFAAILFVAGNLSAREYELWELESAPNSGKSPGLHGSYPYDKGWEHWSYPLGNATLGVNFFGRTDTERLQLSEKTFCNAGIYNDGGNTSLAELYLDFGQEKISNYRRTLKLNDAVGTVAYQSGGVSYTRELFTSYPDDVLVVHLSADKPGSLSFTVRPEIPYLKSKRDIDSKTGEISVEDDTIVLSGTVDYFNLNYEVQVKVLQRGGHLLRRAKTIDVKRADEVTLIVGAGTNYRLSPEIFKKDAKQKLDATLFPHAEVDAKVMAAAGRGFAELKARHLKDYHELFDRVELVLDPEVSDQPTHELLDSYKQGTRSRYLEELMFHYGRYLLISSSRENSLPAHLQGAWNQYEISPWTSGYWHNINVQMNYWGAMSCNLAETFEGYLNYFKAYYPSTFAIATRYLQSVGKDDRVSDDPGMNGWIIGTGCNPYYIENPGGHSGPGTGGLTTKMLMDYYDFTQDKTYLSEVGYPAVLGMSRFLSKMLEEQADGVMLISPSWSPEQRQGGYYKTKGSTFDQGFTWENHEDTLRAAKILGKSDPFLNTIKKEIPKLDPILIGSSGQVKEFREEDAYGDIGQYNHRHISHLCGLYPGTMINPGTPEWMKGASLSLDLRGNNTTGWAMAHRMCSRARLEEGEKALEVYQQFIARKTVPNLWTLHPPFQIDGNFGVMAGVAEMLLQSYLPLERALPLEDIAACDLFSISREDAPNSFVIHLLPALPAAWGESGEVKGLRARGGFTVDIEWENQKLKKALIDSHEGRPFALRIGNRTILLHSEKGQKIEIDQNNFNTAFNALNTKCQQLINSDNDGVTAQAWRVMLALSGKDNVAGLFKASGSFVQDRELKSKEGERIEVNLMPMLPEHVTQPLKLVIVDSTNHGDVEIIRPGVVRYQCNQVGTGSFTWKLTDGETSCSAKVSVAIEPDMTAPKMLSAKIMDDSLFVNFDEPLNSSVENHNLYTINRGVVVKAAKLSEDGKAVILKTSPMRPDGTYQLTVKEITDRAAASNTLASATTSFKYIKLQKGLTYQVYANPRVGDWSWDVPGGSSSAKPEKTGVTPLPSVKLAGRAHNFGIRFLGNIKIENSGEYVFFTSSDDGSMLYINGVEVVDNRGFHGSQTRSGKIKLDAGLHDIIIDYGQSAQGASLDVHWQQPGKAKQQLPANVLWHITD